MNTGTWLLLLFHFINPGLMAQPVSLSFQHYTVSDGLPDNTVNAMKQDSAGFVWIGTNAGLCRFDGHEFQRFVHVKSKPGAICGNIVTALEFQKNGTLWIGTGDGGICYLEKGRKEFQTIKLSDYNIKSVHVNSILYDEEEKGLYLGLDNGGLYFVTIRNGTTKVELLTARLGAVFGLLKTEKGLFFSQPGSGPLLLKNGYIIPSLLEFAYPAITYTVSCFFRDSKQRIWLGTWSDYLIQMKSFNNEFEGFPIYKNQEKNTAGNEITTINEDVDGNLWLGSKLDGLFIYNPEKRQFSHFLASASNPLSLKGSRVFCIMRDRDGRMWIGTDAGINLYDPLTNQFQVTWLGKNENCQVRSFNLSGDTLIAGTDQGIFVKEGESLWKHHPLNLFNDNEQVYQIHKRGNGEIFLGTQNSIYKLDTKDYSVKRLPLKPGAGLDFNNIPSSHFSSLIEFPFRNKPCVMGFAYGHGIIVLENDSALFVFVGPGVHGENLTRKMFADRKGRIWLAGVNNGISLLDWNLILHTDSIRHRSHFEVHTRPIKDKSFEFSNGFDMIENENSYLISTLGNGVIRMTENDSRFQFSNLNIPEINVFGLIQDENKNIWCITSQGLGKFETKTQRYYTFGKQAGVPLVGLGGYFYNAPDGTLFCGGNGFFVQFNPSEIVPDNSIPRCLLTHLSVLDQPSDSLLSIKSLELSFKQNTLSFSCASLYYTNPASIQFSYLLEGLNTGWKSNGNNPVITFTGLQPGDYKLHIRTKTAAGIWSVDEAIYSFNINPPFYQTWWFYILIILLIAVLLFGFYRFRLAQIMKLQIIRNKISRDLHDDIGSALGSISYFSAAGEKSLKENNILATGMVLDKIGSTSREMIESMHDIVWAVNPGKDSFVHLADRIKVHAADLTSANEIKLQFIFDEKLKGLKLPMSARKNIFLIFKEALYNSIKYSSASIIEIKMEISGGKFRMTIADNGKGFNAGTNGGQGFGLKNMQSRADEINGTLLIKSVENEGTEIILILDQLK